jgi:LacI family transcriptional regulator
MPSFNYKSSKRLTVKDIAAMARVSTGTIDRVLHNRGEVSKKTRVKILKIIEENDYQRDILASTLASKKNVRIFALMPAASDETLFWKFPQKGIDNAYQEISHFGIEVSVFHFDYNNKKDFFRQADKVIRQNPDGVLLAPVMHKESKLFIKKCGEEKIPVVIIDTHISDSDCLSYIGQHSFQSGFLAAHLIHYGINEQADYLIVNISKHKDSYHQLHERAKGFKNYFTKNNLGKVSIHEIDIESHQEKEILSVLSSALDKIKNLKGIFVTNSRVYKIASCIEKKKIKNLRIIGYDLLKENTDYLKKGTIDFLISQKPEVQAYKGILTLFNHLVLKKDVEPLQYLPLDIITKENIDYYKF